ncbi:FtsW/RodA/SpoVE family cell cycle protein, partial [Vibrio parahaemolyticus]|nr:FtsW/RodA/SpoVE family cell cycle protein [Vibrio parahaemolyticus]
MPKKVKKRHLMDYTILIPYLILCALGLIMVYSSTSYLLLENGQNPMSSVINQSVFWVLSLVAIALLYKMKTDVLKNQRLIMIAFVVLGLLLIIVLFFGKEVNGAKGWLTIAGFSIQPAEYLKIIAIWYLSLTLANRQNGVQKDFVGSIKRPLALVLGLTVIVAILPDFGNA